MEEQENKSVEEAVNTATVTTESTEANKEEKKKKVTNWIKFSLCALFCLFFTIWSAHWWVLLFIPLLYDIYISRKINWSKWKESKNPILKSIAGWVDAIVFALVAVYIINLYFFQNYKIPSSSMEKTMLVGDYLFVSKVSYGPREPMTLLSFPLVQHTMPIVGGKSFLEHPHFDYNRLSGFGTVERYDPIVFNFPAGDTVATGMENPDYYSLSFQLGLQIAQNDQSIKDNLSSKKTLSDKLDYLSALGRAYIGENPKQFGEIIYRPVDRRENYVKRCIGLPGETLQLKDDQLYIDGKLMKNPEKMQLNYFVESKVPFTEAQLKKLGISKDDQQVITNDYMTQTPGFSSVKQQLGCDTINILYYFPLTQEMLSKLKQNSSIVKITKDPGNILYESRLYPIKSSENWTRSNYGPIYIPKKGASIKLDMNNIYTYERVIKNYEGNTLEIKDGQILINGKPSNSYTFKMDYYWMMGDNRHNSADSRYWGFVPEDHIVGKPVFIWLSLDPDIPSTLGSIRWNRFFKGINHD